MSKFKRNLITTALPYANGPVHIGHLAGVYVPADIYVRYLRKKGEDVAFIGGSVGALIGMYGFHHKTKKAYFTVGVPLILLMQVVVLFYVMNMRIFFGEVS